MSRNSSNEVAAFKIGSLALYLDCEIEMNGWGGEINVFLDMGGMLYSSTAKKSSPVLTCVYTLYSVLRRDSASSIVASNSTQVRLLANWILSDSIPLSMSHDLTAAIVSFDGANVCLIYSGLVAGVNQNRAKLLFPWTNACQSSRFLGAIHPSRIHTPCRGSIASSQWRLG
jgi:hypothetical protein